MTHASPLLLAPLHLHKRPLDASSFQAHIAESLTLGSGVSQSSLAICVAKLRDDAALIETLTCLSQNDDVEVIVVDCTQTTSRDELQRFSHRYIRLHSPLGAAAAFSLGAAHATAPLVAFLHAGARVAPDYAANCRAALRDKTTIAACGRAVTGDRQTIRNDRGRPAPIPNEDASVWRRQEFCDLGGFAAALTQGFGPLLCYRMHELWGKPHAAFVFLPMIEVIYDEAATTPTNADLLQAAREHLSLENRFPLLRSFLAQYSMPWPPMPRKRSLRAAATRALQATRQAWAAQHEHRLSARWRDRTLVTAGAFDFTVVIPHYNLGQTVVAAVRAVMRQSLERVQIIVVDDQSTDPASLAQLRQLEAHVEVLYLEKNGGVSVARNAGIERALAPYVLCLDADDEIGPDYLLQAKHVFDLDEKIGIVSPWVRYHGNKKGTWKTKDNSTIVDALVSSPVPTASCFRKQAWQDAGGYDPGLRGFEDWNLWIGIMKHGWKQRTIPAFHFHYLVRPDSKVNTSNRNAVTLTSRIVENHRETFVEHLPAAFAYKHKKLLESRQKYDRLRRLLTQGPRTADLRKAGDLLWNDMSRRIRETTTGQTLLSLRDKAARLLGSER